MDGGATLVNAVRTTEDVEFDDLLLSAEVRTATLNEAN